MWKSSTYRVVQRGAFASFIVTVIGVEERCYDSGAGTSKVDINKWLPAIVEIVDIPRNSASALTSFIVTVIGVEEKGYGSGAGTGGVDTS